jgi:hypothetical protein
MREFLTLSRTVDEAKVQCAGPATVAALLATVMPQVPPAEWERLAACWIVSLTDAACSVLLEGSRARFLFVWDDGLLAKGVSSEVQSFLAAPRQRIRFGIHACSPVDAKALAGVAPGLTLAIDTHVVGVDRAGDLDAAFVLGVVDTRRNPIPLEAPLPPAVLRLIASGRVEALSGGCGTGLHPVSSELALAASLERLAGEIR